MHEDVVHRVVHEALPHGVEPPRLHRHQHLGPDSVGAHHQHRLPHPGGDPEHPAESPDLPQRERGPGRGDEFPDPGLGVVGRGEVDPGGGVLAFGHAICSGNETCITCWIPFTRSCTWARVTPSNPPIPNFSTAKPPIALP